MLSLCHSMHILLHHFKISYRKHTIFDWTMDYETSLKQLSLAVIHAPFLAMPNFVVD